MIELYAHELTGEHIGKPASASWRGKWSIVQKLKGMESVTDATGRLISRTVIFRDGTQITTRDMQLKIRVWL